jgi:hypothetical protein
LQWRKTLENPLLNIEEGEHGIMTPDVPFFLGPSMGAPES